MQMSQGLDEIAKHYVCGVVEFYSQLKNNPWQSAHDRLEGAVLLHQNDPRFFDRISPCVDEFVSDCKKLIDAYKSVHPDEPNKSPSLFDSFVIADENRVKLLHALEANHCVQCQSLDGVRVTSNKENGYGLYCVQCVPA